jgi:hypothetical protein
MKIPETYFKAHFREVSLMVILDKIVATIEPNEFTTDGVCYTIHIPINLN